MKTYYGSYGGRFVAQPLASILQQLQDAFEKHYNDPSFQEELSYYFRTYVGRPTPLTYLRNISEQLGGARIYAKREDMTNIGAHKINHAIVQGLLAKRMGKTTLIAETGAGMHGTATATVGALLGMKVKVFMGTRDMARQAPNVERMKLLGAEVIGVDLGSKTLKDAVDAAMKYRVANLKDSYYLLGSALGPAPYPQIVRASQEIVGREAKAQFPLISPTQDPDYVIACVGGGSNAIGIFSAFLDNPQVKIIGVEAGGTDTKILGKHAARIAGVGGSLGIAHGYKSYFLQDENGNLAETSSISAGLDYPGIGPEHAFLSDIERVSYVSCNDQEALAAFHLTAKKEGILPALESSHALAYAYKLAPTLSPDTTILVNLSGRGDKDLHTILEYL